VCAVSFSDSENDRGGTVLLVQLPIYFSLANLITLMTCAAKPLTSPQERQKGWIQNVSAREYLCKAEKCFPCTAIFRRQVFTFGQQCNYIWPVMQHQMTTRAFLCRYYTAHVPLILQIPECSAGVLVCQSGQDP